jgi:hypothetical protein
MPAKIGRRVYTADRRVRMLAVVVLDELGRQVFEVADTYHDEPV